MAENDAATQAIHDIVHGLVAAWNRHDPRAFAAAFAEDADFTNVFGMAVKGRGAIEDLHAPIFKTMFRDSRLNVSETRIRFIRPDVAAVDIHWEMTGARDPLGNDWPARKGLLNLTMTEEQGDWSIAVSHNMDLPSADLAKAQAALSER